MKYFLPLMLLVLTGKLTVGQEVKKVKIEELVEYINKSDHPLVVSFWASWCGPCVEEIPWIQAAVEKYAAQKVEFVLVSLDFAKDYPAAVQKTIQQKKFAATYFWLNETNADHFCPLIDQKWDGGIPSTLLINNKTGYRKFFDRQITDRQAEPAVKELVNE